MKAFLLLLTAVIIATCIDISVRFEERNPPKSRADRPVADTATSILEPTAKKMRFRNLSLEVRYAMERQGDGKYVCKRYSRIVEDPIETEVDVIEK